jgi:hypothetical protein
MFPILRIVIFSQQPLQKLLGVRARLVTFARGYMGRDHVPVLSILLEAFDEPVVFLGSPAAIRR